MYCTIKPEEVPPVPDNKFLKRRVPTQENDDIAKREDGEIGLEKLNREKDRDRYRGDRRNNEHDTRDRERDRDR